MSGSKGEQIEVNVDANTRQWVLEPETEYRFELDPGTTLAIKVRHFKVSRTVFPYVHWVL